MKDFVRSDIHCLSTTGNVKAPSPSGPAMFGTVPPFACSISTLTTVKVQIMTTTHSFYATTILVTAGSSLFLTSRLKMLPFASEIGAQP